MINLNPQILEKHGKKEFVILQYEDFLKIQEKPENYYDLCMLSEAKEKEGNAPKISLAEAKKKLKLES